MNYKKLFAVAGVLLVLVAFMAFVVAPNLGGGQQTSFNVVEIYIASWSLNKSVETPGIDVAFRISMDLTGDGIYEAPKTTVFTNTTVVAAPFKIGGPIASSITTFKFKVEVFKIVGTDWQLMYYTADGTTPINEGMNQVEASHSWSYDATGLEGANEYACMISYLYYINFVS